MTASVPFPLPPGRVLTAWRRDLAAFRPRRLRLRHLLLHRVECLVRVVHKRPLDSFRAGLLRQLADAAPLDRLRVDRELLGRWMRDLSAEGLIETAGDWRLTESGRNALESNAYTEATEERRGFTFAEGEAAGRPPTYVALHGPAAPLTPGAGWRFDVSALETCIRLPEEWKTRNGFPTDVDALLAPPADWRRMILDRPEQILLVFVMEGDRTPGGSASRCGPRTGCCKRRRRPSRSAPVRKRRCRSRTNRPRRRGARRGGSGVGSVACPTRTPVASSRRRTGCGLSAPRTLTGRLGGERTDAWLLGGDGADARCRPFGDRGRAIVGFAPPEPGAR